MKRVGSVLLAVLLLGLLSPAAVSSPPPPSGYYELCRLTYTIKPDRTLQVEENITFVNTSPTRVKITITKTIPSPDVDNVYVRDDDGDLDYQLENGAENTTISFETRWIGRGQHYTYYISYTAGGAVSGSGVEYRANLGGISAGEYRHDSYVVIVEGPAGASFFLSNPSAELIENDPPTVRYSTSLDPHESFGGLVVRFYLQPAYYKLTLTERLTNESTEQISNVQLDVTLFNREAGWQFSALASSSRPMKAMYVDEENNWHGVFDLGGISPSGMRTLRLELIYEVNVYDPGIREGGVGPIPGEWPAELSPYLRPDDKWESDHQAIKQGARGVVGGETNAYLVGKSIVEFVVDRLTYQVQTGRSGALQAYQDNVGDCSEYTDLSIALARAARLPARAMYGWSYQGENLGSHAWLEFYFPNKGWQPADPTWAENLENRESYLCRLDPIHLTRNIRGLSSSESGLTFTYHGAAPKSQENVDLLVLTASGAAQEYISAAEYAIGVAEELLTGSPSEDLSQSLQLAQQNLEQAQATSDGNQKIFYAKRSIESANEVIRALGEPPSEAEFDWSLLLPFLIIACAIIAVGLGIYKLRGRR